MSSAGVDSCHQSGLITVEQAIARLLERTLSVTEMETLALAEALGRVLAAPVVSGINVPGFDNSAMDGYAVRSTDCAEPGRRLRVVERIAAGRSGGGTGQGEAARIFTGAPLPPGADAVVMQEQCEADGDEVIVNTAVAAGSNIRLAGEDIADGQQILRAGTRLRQQELGLIASVGIREIEVYRRPRVACFFTGDELREPGERLQPGQIYNSNRYTLNGFLRAQDCEVTDYGIIADDYELTRDTLLAAAAAHDLVLTSGGVSVGEEDYVRTALEAVGKVDFWRIAMKPGKPVAFGQIGDALFMGLPGNPVSVFVTAQVFALPVIHRLKGMAECLPRRLPAIAGFSRGAVKREEYLRARVETVDGQLIASLYPQQGSGVLSSACWADALVVMPIGRAIAQGDAVELLLFSQLV